MVLLERKKLKAQFPNTSENMNVLQFLGFRSDEIKHLFLYGIDIYFCPEGVFTQYGLCKGCQKMFELCVCWAGQKVSYRRMAWEALAVERMLRNDEEYKEYLEDIEPYHGDPVGYLKFFSVKKERSTLRYREIMLGTWPLLEEEKQLVYWIRQEASKGAKFSACLEGRSKSCIIKYGATCVNRRQRCCSTFELGREKVPGRMGGKRRYGLCGSARESWSFSAFAFHDERWTAGSAVRQAAV
ncbi:APG_G0025900.mRNA.1.CDS.1 [Saccharomyces cerevisiae]|nr:APG_G0025900.mRNA.1.CDS.1 [Saccharomyces cerevisiae]CAI7165023.1 APG_G0025900.mRNA.1.CDS.1 [Saccharomyces cerevisiae]